MAAMSATNHCGLHWVVLLLTLGAIVAGCDAPGTRSFDAARFDAGGKVALCFDLDASATPVAGLVVNAQSSAQAEMRTVVLPFESLSIEKVPALLNTWATHGGITIVNYFASPSTALSMTMGIRPAYSTAPDADFSRPDLREPLYLLSSGLKRRFLYRLPATHAGSPTAWQRLNTLPREQIESVILRLPPAAEVFERSTASVAPLVETEVQGGKVKVYPHPRAGEATVSMIDLVYQVPPTTFQNLVFEYGLKLFAVLLVPLVSLAVLTSSKVRAPRARRVLLVTGFSLQAGILGSMLWWVFHIQSVAGSAALFDVLLAVVGAGSTIALFLVKKEE